MKCPKCGYVSHDYLDACRSCSINLVAFKNEISLAILEPGILNLSVLVDRNGLSNANGNGGEYDESNGYLGDSMLVETEELEGNEEDEVDIRLDDEIVNGTPSTGRAPGSLTREFFVPDELLADDSKETPATPKPDTLSNITPPVTEEILNLDFDDETISSETFFTESMTNDSTDIIDMNAVQELRDANDEAEDMGEDMSIDDVELAVEADDLSSINMESAAFDLEDTMLEDDAAITPSEQDDSQPDMILDEFAEFDSTPLQDVVTDDVFDADSTQQEDATIEPPNTSGSLELPDDFQLGDFEVDDTPREDIAVEPPNTSSSFELPDDFHLGDVEVDDTPQEDAAVEPPNISGSLELPDDFHLGDVEVDDTPQEDAAVEPPNISGSLELPDDFQLGDSSMEEVTDVDQSDAVSSAAEDPDHAQPQSEQRSSEKITLSFPIDPNTETLFFDQLSDTSEFANASEQESTGDVVGSPSKPIQLDEITSSEVSSDDLIESTSTLDLDLELPASEVLDEEEITEVPIDTDMSNTDNNKAQS